MIIKSDGILNSEIFIKRPFSSFLVVFLLGSLLAPFAIYTALSVSDTLTRDEIIEIADAYKDHKWTPSEKNIFHGMAPDGFRVETPNEGYQKPTGEAYGWWIPNKENIGIPYQWGGFSSLSDFDKGIEEGKCAGDIWINDDEEVTTGKTKWQASEWAIGVDCSGFVSRCWNLNRKYSTKTLLMASWPITVSDLRKGDILNSPGNHVMIFKEFLNPNMTKIRVYEASGRDWKVNERDYDFEVDNQPYIIYDPKSNKYVTIYRKGHGVALKYNGYTKRYWAYSHFRPILLDASSLTKANTNYQKLKEVLEGEGYIIEELDEGPITYEILREYGIFILPHVELEFSTDEVKAMTDYLYYGGKISIIGEWKGAHLPVTITNLSEICVRASTIPPVADAGPDQTVEEDMSFSFNGSASWDDLWIVNYTWTFRDMDKLITLIGIDPTYGFNNPGTYIVTLNVTDAIGNYDTENVTITVLDVTNPVAEAGTDRTIKVGENVIFHATGSTDNVGIVSYEWDLGDGTRATDEKATHTYNETGTNIVTLTVKDASGNSATDTVKITVEEEITDLEEEWRYPTWIIPVIGAIMIIGVAVYLILIRKPSV